MSVIKKISRHNINGRCALHHSIGAAVSARRIRLGWTGTARIIFCASARANQTSRHRRGNALRISAGAS
jgi:hypothetical protein